MRAGASARLLAPSWPEMILHETRRGVGVEGGWLVNVRFYIAPDDGEPHIYRHDVTEAEVEQVLRRPGEDRPGREGSRVAVGRTRAGRCLRVVYVPDPKPESVFVITAYEMTGKPLAAYRRRMRRKGR